MGLLNELKKENNTLKRDLERKEAVIKTLEKNILKLELNVLINTKY